MEDRISALEERIEVLEQLLKGFLSSEGNDIHLEMRECQGDMSFGDNCTVVQKNCPIGTMVTGSIDVADSQLDDIESRIDDLNSSIDDLEDRIDAAESRAEQLESDVD